MVNTIFLPHYVIVEANMQINFHILPSPLLPSHLDANEKISFLFAEFFRNYSDLAQYDFLSFPILTVWFCILQVPHKKSWLVNINLSGQVGEYIKEYNTNILLVIQEG